MKKLLSFSTLAILIALLAFTSDAYSQKGKGKGMGKAKTTCTQFVDANGDGKCDNCGSTTLSCDGSGKGFGKGLGHKACDSTKCSNTNFIDVNGDGICDNKGTGTCDGSGKGKGKGKGNGKGRGCGSCDTVTFTLGQNIPNPVTNVTRIPFNLKAESTVNVSLFDTFGNKVLVALDSKLSAGDHQVEINTNELTVGNYVYTLTVNGKTISKNMSVTR